MSDSDKKFRCSHARAEWKDEQGNHHTGEIVFHGDSDKAVEDAWRWVNDRKKQSPSRFAEILSLSVGLYLIGVIDKDGYCESTRYHANYSWKPDRRGA